MFDFSSGMGFSVVIHSMGSWVMNPTLKWEGKEENSHHELDTDTWSFVEVFDLVHDLEFSIIGGIKIWWKEFDVDYETLKDLSNDQDAMDLARYALSQKCEIDIYVVFGVSDYEEVIEDEVRGELTRVRRIGERRFVVFVN